MDIEYFFLKIGSASLRGPYRYDSHTILQRPEKSLSAGRGLHIAAAMLQFQLTENPMGSERSRNWMIGKLNDTVS